MFSLVAGTIYLISLFLVRPLPCSRAENLSTAGVLVTFFYCNGRMSSLACVGDESSHSDRARKLGSGISSVRRSRCRPFSTHYSQFRSTIAVPRAVGSLFLVLCRRSRQAASVVNDSRIPYALNCCGLSALSKYAGSESRLAYIRHTKWELAD